MGRRLAPCWKLTAYMNFFMKANYFGREVHLQLLEPIGCVEISSFNINEDCAAGMLAGSCAKLLK